jgi:hypothetical protein
MGLLSFLRYLHVAKPGNRKIGLAVDKSVARGNPGLPRNKSAFRGRLKGEI